MPGLLTLDRGNSSLDAMLHSDPPERRRFDPDDADGAFCWSAAPTRVVGLSVVPGGLDSCAALAQARGLDLQVAGRDLRCPLRLAYPEPERLGVDRWVGAVAAREQFGTAVVVDCGTALTINLVTADGVFHGGAIAPGPHTMARSLATEAPALPAVDLRGDAGLPATSSESAVNAGVVVGFCSMVDGLVDACLEAAGLPAAEVVLTGGGAFVYQRCGARPCHFEPDLIHQGLRWLAARNSNS